MIGRERYLLSLSCSECGKTGVIVWRKVENSIRHVSERTLESLSKSFYERTDSTGRQEVVCSSCHVTAR